MIQSPLCRAHIHMYTVPEGQGKHTFIQFLGAKNMFIVSMETIG